MKEINNGKTLKIIGYVATGLGIVAGLVGDWVSDQQLDQKISEKLAEAMANMTQEVET